jgi:Regulator of chromosome condensation (RCC1) repeat
VCVPASAGAVVYAACGRRHTALLTGAASSSTTASTSMNSSGTTAQHTASSTSNLHSSCSSSSTSGGIVLTFGCGLRGQLGNGSTTDTLTVPTVVRSLEGVGALQPGSSQGGITCESRPLSYAEYLLGDYKSQWLAILNGVRCVAYSTNFLLNSDCSCTAHITCCTTVSLRVTRIELITVSYMQYPRALNTAVACGGWHTAAVSNTGDVYTW